MWSVCPLAKGLDGITCCTLGLEDMPRLYGGNRVAKALLPPAKQSGAGRKDNAIVAGSPNRVGDETIAQVRVSRLGPFDRSMLDNSMRVSAPDS